MEPLGTGLFPQSLWLSLHRRNSHRQSQRRLIGFFELFSLTGKIPLEAAVVVIMGFAGARTTFSTFGALR